MNSDTNNGALQGRIALAVGVAVLAASTAWGAVAGFSS